MNDQFGAEDLMLFTKSFPCELYASEAAWPFSVEEHMLVSALDHLSCSMYISIYAADRILTLDLAMSQH